MEENTKRITAHDVSIAVRHARTGKGAALFEDNPINLETAKHILDLYGCKNGDQLELAAYAVLLGFSAGLIYAQVKATESENAARSPVSGG